MNNRNSISSSGRVSSFDETVGEVTRQLEVECLESRGYSKPQLLEICMIIAEIYMRNPNGSVRIGKELLDNSIVQQVYRKLTAEHVDMVMDNLSRITTVIHNKKQYIRTALYQSVFELEAHYANLFALRQGTS